MTGPPQVLTDVHAPASPAPPARLLASLASELARDGAFTPYPSRERKAAPEPAGRADGYAGGL
jgi:hypothetical protein